MNGRELSNRVGNEEGDGLLRTVLEVLEETDTRHCVIGGLAVNAYTEQPTVPADLDLVVPADRVGDVARAVAARGVEVERSLHRVDLSSPGSGLRIRLHTEPRHRELLPRAEERTVLGHPLRVAAVGDVLREKLRTYQDESRNPTLRVQDLTDIARLVEARPELAEHLPQPVRQRLA